MKAMVLERRAPIESAPLRLLEVPDPEPSDGEVRVKVNVCALCRTDLHVIEGDLPPVKLPVIPGHQVVGEIDKLGPGCKKLRVGQRVGIAWLRHTDGTCGYCRRGRENLCPNSRYTGYMADGGYAEFATIPEDFAYELPEGFSDIAGSPLLCAGLIGYRALQRASVPDGGKLLLIGFGSSAHIVIQLALHRGCRVFVVSRAEKHLKLSRELGAEWAGLSVEGIPEKMDSVILFAPAGELVPDSLSVLDRGGILSIAGIHLSDVPVLNYERHLFYEKEVRSVTANTREDGRALLAEAVAANVQPHVHTFRLEEANEALLRMKRDGIEGTGVLLVR
ncbi:MAG TPA: zinc-dependent alcohol dehydrogenase family protein [Fimbriimonadaceae bacterium]|nr:zinc-dependent alcohol dehydrogenase family protein [Fimbriimonadaceae bacterium]